MTSISNDLRQKPALFMFGFERSGTTLLSMMVGAHPEIAVPLTVNGLWYRYEGMLDHYQYLSQSQHVERLVADLLAEERIRLWDVTLTVEEVLSGPTITNFAMTVARFHELYAEKKGKRLWGNLDIATLEAMDQANRWFPDARFIHIVRDGRDVALSHETMPYGAATTLDCAEAWNSRVKLNLKMGAMLNPKRYLVIRYEDLVLKTEPTLRRICDFFEVEYSSSMLNYQTMVQEKIPIDRRWLWPLLDKPPIRSKAYSWQSKMGTTKRIVFEGTANSLLKELGYDAFDIVPKRASAYALELWQFLCRGRRLLRLAEKFGVKRRSKLERLAERAESRSSKTDYRVLQRDTFGRLARDGTYGPRFTHSPSAHAFVEQCLLEAISCVSPTKQMLILDCGCGPGAWLSFIQQTLSAVRTQQLRLHGFDLTDAMVAIARNRLVNMVPADQIRVGDILDDASYHFGYSNSFDIVFAYDVVQQLPPRLQYEACLTMLRHLAPGGICLIFDFDRKSPHGRRMAIRKFATKYLRMRLVPQYYCNAHYPPLSQFASEIRAIGGYESRVLVARDGKKRSVMIRSNLGRPDQAEALRPPVEKERVATNLGHDCE